MKLTVLQIIPNLGGGGAEQTCAEIVSGLKARGQRGIVISAGGVRADDVVRAGGEHYEYPVASKNPIIIISNAFRLARFISSNEVDIVHARSRAPAWSAWMASRMTKRKFVTTFHAAYKFSNPIKKFYNRVMSRGDRVIAISEFMAKHIRDSYGIGEDKIRTIYRGIDLDSYSPLSVTESSRAALRSAWSVGAADRIVLLPGRISPIKGHRAVIKAMVDVAKKCPDAVLVMVGDDQGRVKYRRELDELVRASGLGDKVRIVPHCADMPAAYALSSVVVMSSVVPEGFGRVPVEAMAMGAPVVASDLGATCETVKDGVTGWLVPFDDVGAWANAITNALNMDAALRAQMSIAAIRHVHGKFSKTNMIRDTLAVYDELI
ncbi:MAG: glycosyltransferase family 4 protein [Alphaproteobacteria bacterium]|nr:glycosyltransferase family 4 protein [Alphaproteobacteria bacterium]